MTLPAFATTDELSARIPGGIQESDEARAQAALDDASALIRDEAGKTWVTDDALDDDVPAIVTTICLKAAQRAFVNPDGLTQEVTGRWSGSYANASPDVYLTKNEKQRIRRAAGRSGLWVQPTTRGTVSDVTRDDSGYAERRAAADATTHLDVTPAGQPIPYLPVED